MLRRTTQLQQHNKTEQCRELEQLNILPWGINPGHRAAKMKAGDLETTLCKEELHDHCVHTEKLRNICDLNI